MQIVITDWNPAALREVIRESRLLEHAGEVVAESAKRRAPVKSGDLQSSIKWEYDPEVPYGLGVKVTEVFYGRFLERGTRFIKRRRRILTRALWALRGKNF